MLTAVVAASHKVAQESVVPESIPWPQILGPHIPPIIFMTFLVWGIIGILSYLAVRKLSIAPNPMQGVFEALISYVTGVADDIIGPDAHKFYPLFVGLFVYILFSNLLGLIPGFTSPTSDPNTTFGLTAIVFLFYHFQGVKEHGFGYIKQFLGPHLPWYMFPVKFLLIITEVMTIFIRPFSLGLRLFCNIFSKELFLAVLAVLILQFINSPALGDKILTSAPFILRPIIILFGLLIGFIQAFVFLVLSISYIAGARSAAEH